MSQHTEKEDFCGVISFHRIYECTFDFSEFLDHIKEKILTIKMTEKENFRGVISFHKIFVHSSIK